MLKLPLYHNWEFILCSVGAQRQKTNPVEGSLACLVGASTVTVCQYHQGNCPGWFLTSSEFGGGQVTYSISLCVGIILLK